MKISISLMKQYSSAEQWQLSLNELVTKIGAQIGAVEEVIDLSNRYNGIKIAQITAARPHPNASKLTVYQMTDGQQEMQVVSGDTSLQVGDKVGWIAPGQTVPSTYGTAAPVVMEARELRGQMSSGMFGSGKELGINDDHQKVMVLDTEHPAGTLLADALDLHDAVIDIENKMFTHRPDCFGNLGVAREIAGIQNVPFISPDWYNIDVQLPSAADNKLPIKVQNNIPKLATRFVAVPIADITVGPSPAWLQSMLYRLGTRPVNNIVDITNYYMMLTGQPLHAYDYDKVKALSGGEAANLVVRHPLPEESITVIGGKQIVPHPDTMVVAAGNTLTCIGGVVGGVNSEVDAHTKNIILEAATWDMFAIRRASMHHGIFTDAVTRFSKGQSPRQNVAVIAKACEDIAKLCGGRVAGTPVDIHDTNELSRHQTPIATTSDFINLRLGTSLSAHDLAVLLNNVECSVENHGDELIVTPPFWRTDITIPEDIVEEVGRLYGYHNLPHELPERSVAAVDVSKMETLKHHVRTILAGAGANELQTYSFVPAKLLQSVGQNPAKAFAIRNALSPELQHYRLSLTPGLLEKVHSNIKAGHSEFGIFELNKIHIKDDVDCDGLPREYQTLAFVYAAKDAKQGAAYYWAKHYLTYLLTVLGVKHDIVIPQYEPHWEIGRQVYAPFEPSRSAYVLSRTGSANGDSEFTGFLGEYHAKAQKNLKLPPYCAGFEVDLERLLKYQKNTAYKPLSRYPSITQDLCFKVPADMPYDRLFTSVVSASVNDARVHMQATPLDIYQPPGNVAYKHVTLRIILQHSERTLTMADAANIVDVITAAAHQQASAERI